MLSYVERRAAALALAAAHEGWGRPPNPEGRPATLRIISLTAELGRKRFRTKEGGWRWGYGHTTPTAVVPNTPALDHQYGAKERRQNREKF